jgi:hypothetical protein
VSDLQLILFQSSRSSRDQENATHLLIGVTNQQILDDIPCAWTMPAFGKKLKRGEISQLVNFATQFRPRN